MALGGFVLGSLLIYLKGMRRMMFQLSGFYYRCAAWRQFGWHFAVAWLEALVLEGVVGLDGLKVKGCGSFRVQGRRLSLGFKGSGLKPLSPQKGLKGLRVVGSGLFEGMRLLSKDPSSPIFSCFRFDCRRGFGLARSPSRRAGYELYP